MTDIFNKGLTWVHSLSIIQKTHHVATTQTGIKYWNQQQEKKLHSYIWKTIYRVYKTDQYQKQAVNYKSKMTYENENYFRKVSVW